MTNEEKQMGRIAAAYIAVIAAFCVVLWVFSSGCATVPAPSGNGAVLNPPNAQGGASVAKGWVDDYSKYVEQNVPPSLLAYPPESVCPKYLSLSDAAKRKFWSSWFQSIAYPESGFDRTQRYKEPGMKDSQGNQVYSEGLLQLSLQDASNYKTPNCLRMVDKPVKADTDPTRAIFDPYVNLGCGMEIAARLVAIHPKEFFVDALSHYWSTVGDGKVKAYFDAHFAGLCK